jgi:hypothetical protein
LAWHPDGQRVLVSSDKGSLLVDLVSLKYQIVNFPKSDSGSSLVRAVAYSPDGKQLADAVVYPAVYSVRDIEMTEIGVRNDEQSIPNGRSRQLLAAPTNSLLTFPRSLLPLKKHGIGFIRWTVRRIAR